MSTTPPSDDPAAERMARRTGTAAMIPWAGCPLVPADDKDQKFVPATAECGVKLELKGWEAAGDVPKARLGSRIHVTLITDLDMTVDDVHRQYGHGIYFAQLYTLDPTTKAMAKAITGQTHTMLPCMFDEPDRDTDPVEPEDDVGSQVWPIAAKDVQANPLLRSEIARRRDVIRDLMDEDDYDDRRDDRDDDDDRRGGRGNDRGRGGRPDPRDMRGGRGGMPHGGMPRRPMEDPEWMFDPNTRPTAPPPTGFMWAFGGNPMKWFHTERTNEAVAAVVPPPAPVVVPAPVVREPSFFETAGGAAFITGALTALATIGAKIAEGRPPAPPPPDPMVAIAALMASLNGNKGDPERLKQLEIDAEDRRVKAAAEAEERRTRLAIEAEERRTTAAAALETARLERESAATRAAAEAADKQRAHDAKMEAERRVAAEAAAVTADDRAKQRAKDDADRLLMMSQLGLNKPSGPTPEQIQAERNFAVLQAQFEMMKNQPKSPDTLAAFTEAKALFAKLGINVASGDKVNMGEALLEAANSEAAKALLTGPLSVPLQMLLFKLANAVPGSTAGPQQPPPQQAPVQGPPVTVQQDRAAIEAEIARREQIAFEEGIRRTQLEAAQQVAAAQAQVQGQQQPPAPDASQVAPQWEAHAQPPPAMPQWEAVASPDVPVVPQWQAVEPPYEAPPVVVHEATAESLASDPVVWEQHAAVVPVAEVAPEAVVPQETAANASPEAATAPAEPEAPPPAEAPVVPEQPVEPDPVPAVPPREPEPPPAVVETPSVPEREAVVEVQA